MSRRYSGRIERYALTKPFYALPPTGYERGLEEVVHYQFNFTNTIQLLGLPGGSRVLDVACGAGCEALEIAGLRHVEFVAPTNSFFSLNDPRVPPYRRSPAAATRSYEPGDLRQERSCRRLSHPSHRPPPMLWTAT
jgi:hypothetical protein